ncbi:hypothetical protein CBS63078_1190 [Aspergillus niger]|nr:hypothetical protein CBS115989_218 [Aspergillus niger]KAI2845905.1 hypothetical protein CBS11350_3969 [Aspergillus niger]KAI2861479.1 hypothetical protein CBS12448_4806 [Aspergillus niger]KAI2862568.1 hypothetical protein CBS11232_51 [Aspergillus niger]KAI2878184.1 hypothetical protein CBS115988_3255 [Aspergillus niger]
METNKHQKDLDRLARIRENQRNSRARKQQHTRELEQKLAALQEQARRKDVDHRMAVQKLEAENRKLKYLLTRSGLTSELLERYLQTDEPALTEKVAIPKLRSTKTPCKSQASPVSLPKARNAATSALQSNELGIPSPGQSCDLATMPPSGTVQGAPDLEVPVRDQSVCGCGPGEAVESWPSNGDVLNTTLCAIADELIDQYNTRGVELSEIRRKLWAGFSKGLTTEEGCRVQNHILFQVLDEISNS